MAAEAFDHWIDNSHGPQALAPGLVFPQAIGALAAGYAVRYATQKAIEAALVLIAWASTRSAPDQQPVLSFKAYPYERDEAGGWRLNVAGIATQKQLEEICGDGINTIQFETDEAFKNLKPMANSITRSKFGIDIHKAVKAGVDEKGDPRVRTEQAITKQGGGYGEEDTKLNKKDSIRIDVLEKNGEQTICVHDIKTGRGLTKERIDEILRKISSAFRKATHIVITEVRPAGAPPGSWRTLKGQ